MFSNSLDLNIPEFRSLWCIFLVHLLILNANKTFRIKTYNIALYELIFILLYFAAQQGSHKSWDIFKFKLFQFK